VDDDQMFLLSTYMWKRTLVVSIFFSLRK